jgi:translocation and assembly module TamB
MMVMRRISAGVTALVLTALSIFLFIPRLSDATNRAISESVRDIRSRFEGALGLSLSFDYLSPSILRSASFSRLSISAPGGRTLLYARKVRALYDVIAVLRGKSSEALTGLELEDVTLDIRLPEDKAILLRFGAFFREGGGAGLLPRIVVMGKNVSASLAIAGFGTASFDAREVGFSTTKDEPAISLEGRFSLELAGRGLGTISGPLSLSGSLSRNFRKARLGLSIAADSRDFALSMQHFELVYGDRQLAFTKVKDRAPLDADIRVNFGDGESSVSLRLDGYAPSRSLKLFGRFASFEPWLEIPYSGSLALRMPGFDLARIDYDLRLSGSLPARFSPGDSPAVRAELAARGDASSISVEKARLEHGSDSLEYAGSFRFQDLSPDGVLDLRLSLMEGKLSVASSVRLVGHGGEYAAMADQATIGGVVFRDIAFAAARKGLQADFNLSFRPPSSADEESDLPVSRFSGEAGDASGMSIVRCEGSVSLDTNPNLELSVDLETIDLGPFEPLIAALTDSPEAASLISSLRLGGVLFATSDFKRLSWSAPDLTVVSRSVPSAYALLSLSGTSNSVVVKHALVSAAGYSVEGLGKVDFSEAGRLGFEASLALKDIPYAIKGVINGHGLSITGDYGLKVSITTVDADSFVSAKAIGLPLPINGGLFLATIDAEGRFASLQDWDMSVAEFDLVPTGEKMAGIPKVELAGSFGPSSADLSRLHIEDRLSSLSGKAILEYSLLNPLAVHISSRLSAGGEGKPSLPLESYAIDARYSAGKIDCVVDLIASPLARIGKLPVIGSADGRIAIKGDLADPSVDFRLKLRDGRYLNQTLVLGASGSYGGGILELRDVMAAYQAQSISGGTARFSFADASAKVALAYSGTIIGERVKFLLSAQCASTRVPATRGVGGALSEMLESYNAKGSLSGFSFGSISMKTWPFEASMDPASVKLVGGASGELRFKFATDHSFSASLRDPFPVRAEVSGTFDGKNMDMSVQGLLFDLSLLSPLMPHDLIKIKSGRARGGFRAVGLANDPEITGEIDLEDTSLKILGWISDDIGPFKASIVAKGRNVSVTVPSVKAGKATIALGCQATFDHWMPSGLTASVKTIGRSRVSLDSVIVGIHAKGDAAADLRFALQGDMLVLDCDVTLDKGTVVVSPATLAQNNGNPPKPQVFISVAANVRFGRRVHIFFPSSDFPVISGFSDPSSRLAIRYDQSSEDFSLKGAVALRGGQVFYIQRNFFLKNGKIVFNEGTDRFEPRVTLLAELRDSNDAGPVTITLRADNAPLSTFKPRLSSDPVMTESQIALLMGQNLFGTSSDSQLDIRKAVITGSEFIPQLNVARVFQDKLRDVFGLDMFYLNTQVLQNWLIDVSGQSPSTPSSTLNRYFDQSELYAGKYLTDSIFAHASMRVENNPLAGANTLGLDSELGLEMDSPFGLIQWSMDKKSWDNLVISDESLSLSWKLAY